jgi:hypothetical protein
MEKRFERSIFFIVILLLLLLTRIPAMSEYFSIDNVNLALSLEKFDPRIHQPHPPGYPLFVGFARLVQFGFHDAARAFDAISILVSMLSLWMAYLLGSRMFSPWAGVAGALLLLVNPVFWQTGISGPLRPNLAFFSLLIAYCCWRCWNGEKSFAMWGAVALGIGGGFRPDLVAFMFPLWLIASWMGTRSWRTIFAGAFVMGAIIAVWVSATVIATGGFRTFWTIMTGYAADWNRFSSAAQNASIMEWLRQKNRLFIYNWLGVFSWIWAVPFYFLNRERESLGAKRSVFFVLWIVPGIIVQSLTHFAEPAHTLFSVAALCLGGGYMLSWMLARQSILTAALFLNALLFLNFFPLLSSATVPSGDGKPSIKNAVLVGAYESSIEFIRNMDSITRVTLDEIQKFTPPDRPSIIVTTDTVEKEWFMNWRIGRYYLPKRDLWILAPGQANKQIAHVRRDKLLEYRASNAITIPVFRQGRILWVLEPNSPFAQALAGKTLLNRGRYVFYTDITPDSPPLVVDGYTFVPTKTGSN